MDVRLENGTIIRNVPDGTTKQQLTEMLERNNLSIAKQVISEPQTSLAGKLAMGDRPELSFPQYAGKAIKEMAIPMATTALGAASGGLPGAMIGSGHGEALNQKLGIYGKSVMPGVDQYDATRIAIATGAPAVLPLIAKGAQGAKWLGGKAGDFIQRTIEPLSQKGQASILARSRAEMAANDPQILTQAAHAAENAKTYVPGSFPTAGQAIADADVRGATGLVAHELALAKHKGLSPMYQQRIGAQETARSGALAPIAGTAQELEAAIAKRTKDAGNLYDQAYNVIFQGKIPKSLATNPYIKEALPDAIKLAKANGIDPSTNLTEFAHFIKIGLDKQLSRTGDLALHHTEKAAVQTAKENLLGWLKQKNPLYDQARQTFSDLSRDPNRMQVGQYLQGKLDSPLETVGGQSIPKSERAAQFAQAILDAPKTIKNATGQGVVKELSDVLNPRDMSTVQNIARDLARAEATKRLGAQTSMNVTDTIPGDVGAHIPNLLYRPTMIANAALRAMGRNAEDEIGKTAMRQALDPKLYAQAIRGTIPYAMAKQSGNVPSRYDLMIQELLKRQAPFAAGAATQAQ